jgi:hypothetical protein
LLAKPEFSESRVFRVKSPGGIWTMSSPRLQQRENVKRGGREPRIKGKRDEELVFIQVLRNSDVFNSKWKEIMAALSCMAL